MTAKPIIRRPYPAWICAVLLSLGALVATPLRAEISEEQMRVAVNVIDLIFRSGLPYYYERGYYYPVMVEYDHLHRPVYYRYVTRPVVVPVTPPGYYAPPRYYPPVPVTPRYRVGYDRRGHGWGGKGHRGHHGHRGHSGHRRGRGRN